MYLERIVPKHGPEQLTPPETQNCDPNSVALDQLGMSQPSSHKGINLSTFRPSQCSGSSGDAVVVITGAWHGTSRVVFTATQGHPKTINPDDNLVEM